jgi:hypothetical protein
VKSYHDLIIIFLFILPISAQIPEWVEIDFQQFMMYDATTYSYFSDLDLTDQEIFNIYNGDYGSLWFETQDYKIKFLPNNLIFYSKKICDIPLLFAPCSYNSINYYSRIIDGDLADKLQSNTWVKYSDSDNYNYFIKINEKKIIDESGFEYYGLENYSLPISNEKEINPNEITSSFLINFCEVWSRSDAGEKVESLNRSLSNSIDKLFYRKTFKSNPEAEKCFDILADSNKNLWIATGKRLIRFDGSKFYEINIPALTLTSDLQKNLWIGTTAYNSIGSLIKFDGVDFTYYNSLNSPLPDNDGIFDIETDYQGNLWIAFKRTGLPGKPDNIKLAVYNPCGVKIITDSFLNSIQWIRKPFDQNLKSIFIDQFFITMTPEYFSPYNKLEPLLNNKIIKTIDTKNEFAKNEVFESSFFVDRPDKYSFKVYAYELNNNKIEFANYNLNNEFNSEGFFLSQNEPNPFSKYTWIEYGFFQGQKLELKIFDLFMREVNSYSEKYNEWIGKPFLFESKDLPDGVYYYYLKENYSGIIDAKKMILFDPEKIKFLPH